MAGRSILIRVAVVLLAGSGLSLASTWSLTTAEAASTVPLVMNLANTHDPSGADGQQRFVNSTATIGDSSVRRTLAGIEVKTQTTEASPVAVSFGLYPAGVQRSLHTGLLTGVHNGTGELRYPDVSMSIGSHSLDTELGDVDILDLATDATGQVIRFDLVYRFGADHPGDVDFGEIRMGEPESSDHVLSSRAISWPMAPVGVTDVPATEWISNTGSAALPVGEPSISGDNGADFTVLSDDCPASLPVGGVCSVKLGYSPSGPGSRAASLAVPVGAGVDQVSLTSESPIGRTEITSAGNDAVDGGQTHDFRDGAAVQIVARGSTAGLHFFTTSFGGNDPQWSVIVLAAAGTDLAPGSYSFDNIGDTSQTRAEVTGGGTACANYSGTITINRLAFTEQGDLAIADISLALGCLNTTVTPMTASVAYRLTNTPRPVITPIPTTVPYQAVSALRGTATPGASVRLWEQDKANGPYYLISVATADGQGHFTIDMKAYADVLYYVTADGYRTSTYRNLVRAVIAQPAVNTVGKGQVFTMTGTGLPSTLVQFEFHQLVSGAGLTHSNLMVDSTGKWIKRFVVTAPYHVRVTGLANGVVGNLITINLAR